MRLRRRIGIWERISTGWSHWHMRTGWRRWSRRIRGWEGGTVNWLLRCLTWRIRWGIWRTVKGVSKVRHRGHNYSLYKMLMLSKDHRLALLQWCEWGRERSIWWLDKLKRMKISIKNSMKWLKRINKDLLNFRAIWKRSIRYLENL